jgi:predicted glycoside hydrolase/deacetylase ChbG (UPF0249 family)
LSERILIMSADDFGRSPGINAGVIKARREGIVTSAGLMVRWPAAAEAATFARTNSGLSLGLHVDLGEWSYRDGTWITSYRRVATPGDRGAVEAEVQMQLEAFRRLVGSDPTHLDSHQHVHTRSPTDSVLCELGAELGVPVRHVTEEVRYCGDFYGQTEKEEPFHEAITAESLIELIRSLPPGTTEIGGHPALGDDSGTPYRGERELELGALCDPRVAAALRDEGIALRSFAEIAR